MAGPMRTIGSGMSCGLGLGFLGVVEGEGGDPQRLLGEGRSSSSRRLSVKGDLRPLYRSESEYWGEVAAVGMRGLVCV